MHSLRKTSLILLLMASALLASSFTGCRPGGRRVVTVRFWNGFTGPDGRTMLRLVKRFNQENPDVDVLMQRMDWATYYNKLFVAGLGGRAPEVFVLQTLAIPRFAKADFVRGVDDLCAQPNGIDVRDIDANIWQGVAVAGKHYGAPLDIWPMGMYYNRRLFREAGIVDARGESKPPANRAEFLEAMRKLTHPASGGKPDQWGFVFTNFESNVYSFMLQFGGEFFTPDYTRCIMNGPRNVAALQFCVDLIRKYRYAPPPENYDAWIGFRQGKIGMVFEGIYMLADLQKQQDLDFGGAPAPDVGERQAVWAGSHNLCLRADLQGPELQASWRFIKFLSDNSLDWAAGGQIPVRKSLRETPRFKAMAVQSAFAREIPYAVYHPRLPFIFEYQTEFNNAVEKALRGSAKPQEALDTATANINKIMARERDAGAGGGAMTRNRLLRRWSGYLYALPYLTLFGLFIVLPLLYGLRLSLFRWEMLSRLQPQFAGLGNYAEAVRDPYFWKSLVATFKFVALAVPLTVCIALLIAVGLKSLQGRRQSFYRAAYFAPTILTISVAGILWRWFYNSEFGLFNAYLGRLGIKIPWLTDTNWAMISIVLMTLWWTVGGPMVVVLAGLQNIPPQYHEAAALDGATGWKSFRYITLPLLRPVLLFVVVINVIGAFQVFGQTFMITRGGPEMSTRSLVQYIYETAFNNYRMGYAAALSWLLFLVIAVFSLAQFRLMRER